MLSWWIVGEASNMAAIDGKRIQPITARTILVCTHCMVPLCDAAGSVETILPWQWKGGGWRGEETRTGERGWKLEDNDASGTFAADGKLMQTATSDTTLDCAHWGSYAVAQSRRKPHCLGGEREVVGEGKWWLVCVAEHKICALMSFSHLTVL